MVDMLQSFLPFVDKAPGRLGYYIVNHSWLNIAKKYCSMSDELSKARLSMLGAATFSPDGTFTIDNGPGSRDIMGKISELQSKVARLVEISKEYGGLLESVGVTNPTMETNGIHEKLHILTSRTQIEPAIWQRFEQMHKGKPQRMPGEILNDPEYSEYEKQLIAQRDAANAQLPVLREIVGKLETLTEEAIAL